MTACHDRIQSCLHLWLALMRYFFGVCAVATETSASTCGMNKLSRAPTKAEVPLKLHDASYAFLFHKYFQKCNHKFSETYSQIFQKYFQKGFQIHKYVHKYFQKCVMSQKVFQKVFQKYFTNQLFRRIRAYSDHGHL